MNGPYSEEGLNTIYHLLFCDNIELFKANTKPGGYPWTGLLKSNPQKDELEKIATDLELESRQRLLAFRQLAANTDAVLPKQLLGIVIEMGLPEGLDVLAAYEDGTARYLNYTGKMIIWETRTAESDRLISELFSAGNTVVKQIGPWNQPRRPFRGEGMIRMSFLVTDGLYFGEGPFTVLEKDPMGGPVIHAATELLIYLTSQ